MGNVEGKPWSLAWVGSQAGGGVSTEARQWPLGGVEMAGASAC